MGRTLILTTPAERGSDVTETQRLMSGQDGSPYVVFHGAIDGVYGPVTAAAVKHGKYVLGYPLPELDQQAGDTFRGLLGTPVSKLPEDYQTRRVFRLQPPPDKTPRQLALARAVTQIGKTESPPGSNLQPYGAWYGFNGVSWCAIFQTWCWEPYAPATFVRGQRYAYVPYIRADALGHSHGLSIVESPIPGDLVLYFWSGLGAPGDSHIGVIESGDAHSWTAIEGNTSAGNNSNGGQVMRRERKAGDAATTIFVRVTS